MLGSGTGMRWGTWAVQEYMHEMSEVASGRSLSGPLHPRPEILRRQSLSPQFAMLHHCLPAVLQAETLQGLLHRTTVGHRRSPYTATSIITLVLVLLLVVPTPGTY